MCMSGAQKDVGSLELEFRKDVSHHVGTKSLGPCQEQVLLMGVPS